MTVAKFKILYTNENKSFIRKFLLNPFLYILSKLFPKNFESYKFKIISFIKKFGLFKTFIYRLLKSIFLKIKYPKYYNLPASHIISLDALIKFLKILEKKRIHFFFIGGSLLGAIRQESFAGRPTDVDLGIKENDLSKLLDSIPLIIKGGATIVRRWPFNKVNRLQIFFPFALIDIAVYRKKNKKWLGEVEKYYNNKFKGITFNISDLENLVPVHAYGKKFFAPNNSTSYLKKKYGEKWKIPNKKQFFWKSC
tara:strand:- start:104 stop:859 length:756 start_codon:yes stop_codon:yes gene_type:complete